MGECKRIFGSTRRMGLLVLLAVVCAALFFSTLMPTVGPRQVQNALNAGSYGAHLAERLRDVPAQEQSALVQAEIERINNFEWYWDGYPDAVAALGTDENAYASIADVPGLADAARTGDSSTIYWACQALWDVLEDMNAQIDYQAGYAAYLDTVQSQAQMQSQTSLFGVEGSFSRRNLAKTAEEFDGLRGRSVAFGNNRGVEKWLSFRLGDYFHLIAVVMFVMAFLEERKKGLWSTVRAARGGRLRLGLTRLGILCASSVLATALYSALPLILSLAVNGGWGDMGRTLQSLESFKTCTVQITIGQWLGLYFALKIVTGVCVGLLLWCVLGTLANIQFALAVLGTMLAGEYALYTLLPVQSLFNLFKYFNIFSYVHTATLYTEYLNVDLGGWPMGIRALTLGALPVLLVLLAAWALLLARNRRPEGNRDRLGRLALCLNRALDWFRARFSLGAWEVYKSMVFQYGVLVLALVVLAGQNLIYTMGDPSGPSGMYLLYVQDMQGPLDESADEYLAHARQSAADSQNADELNAALDTLEARVTELRARAEEGGYDPWLVLETDYTGTYGPAGRDRQRLNGAVAILFTVFLCAGVGAFERQSGVTGMVRATKRGRGGLLRRKAALAAALAAAVWAVVYMRELWSFAHLYIRPATMVAPVQNIDALADFPLPVTFGQYLALLYVVRLVMLMGVGFTVLFISQRSPNVRTAYITGAGVLGVPALMTALGAEMFKWVSPVVPVASAELMWGLGSGSWRYLLPWAAWLAVSLAALVLLHRAWVGRAGK